MEAVAASYTSGVVAGLMMRKFGDVVLGYWVNFGIIGV